MTEQPEIAFFWKTFIIQPKFQMDCFVIYFTAVLNLVV